MTLKEVAARVNELHEEILRPLRSKLDMAIECGELLIGAQGRVKPGLWGHWLDTNVAVHRTTAYGYMRLARHKDEIRAAGYTGIDPALAGLSEKRELSLTERQEMLKLHEGGLSLDQIAASYGVARSTAWFWCSPRSVNRVKRLQRKQREREARAAEVKRAERGVAQLSGPLAQVFALFKEATALLEKYAQDPHHAEEQQHVLEALAAANAAKHEIVQALTKRRKVA